MNADERGSFDLDLARLERDPLRGGLRPPSLSGSAGNRLAQILLVCRFREGAFPRIPTRMVSRAAWAPEGVALKPHSASAFIRVHLRLKSFRPSSHNVKNCLRHCNRMGDWHRTALAGQGSHPRDLEKK